MIVKTLRRKQQKKAKRLRYRQCPECHYTYIICHLIDDIPLQKCNNCGFKRKMPWLGGGIGRRIPQDSSGKGIMPV